MELFITSDTNWESGIDKIVDNFHDTDFDYFFSERNYGYSLAGIAIVLMCRNKNLKFKQRIKYSKTEQILYLDILLNLDQMKSIDDNERRGIVAKKIIEELPVIIDRYKFSNFEIDRFIKDLKMKFKKMKWIDNVI